MLKTIDKTKLSNLTAIDAEMGRMKRLPRGSFKVKPTETDLRNCKVKITMYIDADILEYFKGRASQPDAAPYQTQINSELRKVAEKASRKSTNVDDLLKDKTFLKALKEKLAAV